LDISADAMAMIDADQVEFEQDNIFRQVKSLLHDFLGCCIFRIITRIMKPVKPPILVIFIGTMFASVWEETKSTHRKTHLFDLVTK